MEYVRKCIDYLDGFKSYTGGTIIFLAGGLRALEFIDEETFKMAVAFGASVSIIGLRHALTKPIRRR